MKNFLVGLTLFAALTLSACRGHTRLPELEQTRARKKLMGQRRQLSGSLYTGKFYRDSRYGMLSHIPPQDLDLLRDPKGERIEAPEATGIVSAGTLVTIQKVEFATAGNVTGRSLMTPRYFTWVYVDVPGLKKPQIIVVRDNPNTHEAFMKSLSRWLTEEDVAKKVAELPEPLRLAVENKRLMKGMPAEAARLSWGPPMQNSQSFEGGMKVNTWKYEGERGVLVRDDVVEDWEDPWEGEIFGSDPKAPREYVAEAPAVEAPAEAGGEADTEGAAATEDPATDTTAE